MPRKNLLTSFAALSTLALVAGLHGGTVAAAPQRAAAAADPCTATSVLTEPAGCLPAGRPSADSGSDVPIPAGNAFIDGMSTSGGADPDKQTFLPGNMTSTAQVADETLAVDSVFGYDFSPDGSVLYGVNFTSSTLVTVNQTTGAYTTVGPMVPPAGHTWIDLTINPATGAAYAASESASEYSLFSLNLATGATTLIATVPTTTLPIDLSMNCAGQMYMETINDDSLYAVNPATGALTLKGATGVNTSFAQGMDFDNATGVLHAWLYQGGGVMTYASLNLTTGLATAFAGTTHPGEYEGAIKTPCPAATAAVTSGPTGHTADLRPTFGFTTTNATTVQCSVDKGTAAFTACPGATFQPASDLTPGSYTFRVKATGTGAAADATRAFTVVDCATLKANVTKATAKAAKAKAKVKKAKKTGNPVKIKKAKAKLKKAKKALKAAKAALAAEPVCA